MMYKHWARIPVDITDIGFTFTFVYVAGKHKQWTEIVEFVG